MGYSLEVCSKCSKIDSEANLHFDDSDNCVHYNKKYCTDKYDKNKYCKSKDMIQEIEESGVTYISLRKMFGHVNPFTLHGVMTDKAKPSKDDTKIFDNFFNLIDECLKLYMNGEYYDKKIDEIRKYMY